MISPKRGINLNVGDNYQSPLPPNRNPKLYKTKASPRESRVQNTNNNNENISKDFDTRFDINDSIISPMPKKKFLKKNIKDMKSELITSFISDQSIGLYKGDNDGLKQLQSKASSNIITSDSQLQGTMLQQSLEELNFFIISNGNTIYGDQTINYIIRVFPGQSFSMSLFVINTNQSWNLFIPYNENVIHLRHIQTKLTMSSQWKIFADIILKCIHVTIEDGYIVSVNFDNDGFLNDCGNEINNIVHNLNNNSDRKNIKHYLNDNKFILQEPSTAMKRIFNYSEDYKSSDNIINNDVDITNNEYINLDSFVSSQSFSESIVLENPSENSISLMKKNQNNNKVLNKTEKSAIRRERLLKCLDIYTKKSISNTLKSTVVKEISNMKTEMSKTLQDFQVEIKLLRDQILSSSDYAHHSSMEWMKSDLEIRTENLSLMSNFADKKDVITLKNDMSALMIRFQEDFNQLQEEMNQISLEQTTIQDNLLLDIGSPYNSPISNIIGSPTTFNSPISENIRKSIRQSPKLNNPTNLHAILDNNNNNNNNNNINNTTNNNNNTSALSDILGTSNDSAAFGNQISSSYPRTLGNVGLYTNKDGNVVTKPERSNLTVQEVENLFSRLNTLEKRLAKVESKPLSFQKRLDEPICYVDKNIASDRLKKVFRKVVRNNFYTKYRGTAVFRMKAVERIIAITDNTKVISLTLDDCISTGNNDLCIHTMRRVVHVFTIEHPDAISMKNIKPRQILNIMNTFINDTNILKLSYDAINAMISDDASSLIINDIKDDLASSDQCGLLLNAINDYTNNPLITFRATRCLYKMTIEHPKFSHRLCQGNVQLLVQLFSQSSENPSVLENLAKLVINLCQDNTINQDRLAEVGLGEHIIGCIERFSSNERLVYLLCKSLSSLTNKKHKANQLVCSRNKSPEIIIEILQLHQQSPLIIEQLSKTLLSLCSKSKTIKNVYIDKGILKLIPDIFKNYLDIIDNNEGKITVVNIKVLSYYLWVIGITILFIYLCICY
jgi:hypothetical protein